MRRLFGLFGARRAAIIHHPFMVALPEVQPGDDEREHAHRLTERDPEPKPALGVGRVAHPTLPVRRSGQGRRLDDLDPVAVRVLDEGDALHAALLQPFLEWDA